MPSLLNFYSQNDLETINLDRVDNMRISYFHTKDQIPSHTETIGFFDDGYHWMVDIWFRNRDHSMELWLTEEEAIALLKKLNGVNNPNSGLSWREA